MRQHRHGGAHRPPSHSAGRNKLQLHEDSFDHQIATKGTYKALKRASLLDEEAQDGRNGAMAEPWYLRLFCSPCRRGLSRQEHPDRPIEPQAKGKKEEMPKPPSKQEFDESGYRLLKMASEPLPENIYGLFIATIIRDPKSAHKEGKRSHHYFFRVLTSAITYFSVLAMQFFLIKMAKYVITPMEVRNIREQYSEYERLMYVDGAGVSHTYTNANGWTRGVQGYFNESRFDTLPHVLLDEVCQVPLSNEPFIFCILCSWFIVILSELRNAINLTLRVVLGMRHTMSQELEEFKDDETGIVVKIHPDTSQYIVKKVPLCIKLVILVFVQVPRIIMCLYLGWLGARWLTATCNYADVLLNTCSLTLIFEIGMIVFQAGVPYHTKVMVTQTYIPHLRKMEPEDPSRVLGMFALLAFATLVTALWIYGVPESFGGAHDLLNNSHMHQRVLPGYNWDLHEVCTDYLAEMMSTDATSEVSTLGRGGKGR